MKKSLITIAIVLLAVAAQAQIKMHSNGRITLQTLVNTTTQGISIDPAPNWNVDINGQVYFHQTGVFKKNAPAYDWLACSYATNPLAVSWLTVYPNWNTLTFYVQGKGDVYAKNYYTIASSSSGDSSKGTDTPQPIEGTQAIEVVTRLNGYYYAPEELEIPDLEGNENVDPEAIDAMLADFSKRTAALSAGNLEEVFPEAVRTDQQNRLCIDYQSVVTMLVEAVKQQQREIDELKAALQKNNKNK